MPKPTKRSSLPPADAVFLTRAEAAGLLRINIQLIDRLINEERLPAFRPVGRRILLRREDVLRVVAENPIWGLRNAKR